MIFYILIFTTFFSCKERQNDFSESSQQPTYTINGEIFNKDQEIIYLKIIKNNLIEIIDSSIIQNSKFLYKGSIIFPHKAIIQLKDHSTNFPFILANEQVVIKLNTSQMDKSIILNSPINSELKSIQTKSAAIYKEIDYLFPQLQKARMENDFETLKEINTKINAIIAENQNYLFNYIQKHPNNYLSGLLLDDMWQTSEKDSLQLNKLTNNLAPEIRKILNFSIH